MRGKPSNKQLQNNSLSAQQERFEFAVTQTGVGVWDLLLSGKQPNTSALASDENHLIWNNNMFKLFNVDPNTFGYQYDDFEKCVHPDDRQKVRLHIVKCFDTQSILKAKFRIISHPGAVRYIAAQAKVTYDEQGQPIRLTGINQDITSLIQEKHKVKQLYNQIKESEAKYRALFETSSDAIMLLDNHRFIECNDATLTVFGCESRAQFLGTHPSDFSPRQQANGQPSDVAANQRIAQAQQQGMASFLWTHRRLNGEVFPAQVLLTPVVIDERMIVQATVRDITQQVAMQKKLLELSTHDQLTGLYNRNQLQKALQSEIERSHRSRIPLSVMMLDIDWFKSINDNYGHHMGDRVLKHFADIVTSIVRTNDSVIRFGGDEFVILLPETSQQAAFELAERIRQMIAKNIIAGEHNKNIHFSVSIGIAAYPQDGLEPSELLNAADQALYLAKRSGRNQTKQH